MQKWWRCSDWRNKRGGGGRRRWSKEGGREGVSEWVSVREREGERERGL